MVGVFTDRSRINHSQVKAGLCKSLEKYIYPFFKFYQLNKDELGLSLTAGNIYKEDELVGENTDQW